MYNLYQRLFFIALLYLLNSSVLSAQSIKVVIGTTEVLDSLSNENSRAIIISCQDTIGKQLKEIKHINEVLIEGCKEMQAPRFLDGKMVDKLSVKNTVFQKKYSSKPKIELRGISSIHTENVLEFVFFLRRINFKKPNKIALYLDRTPTFHLGYFPEASVHSVEVLSKKTSNTDSRQGIRINNSFEKIEEIYIDKVFVSLDPPEDNSTTQFYLPNLKRLSLRDEAILYMDCYDPDTCTICYNSDVCNIFGDKLEYLSSWNASNPFSNSMHVAQQKNLRIINLTNSGGANVLKGLVKLDKLESVTLSLNGLSSIPQLDSMPNWTELGCFNLSYNRIEAVPNLCKNSLDLTHFDLNNNKIQNWEEGVIPKAKLAYLDLSQNALDSLPKDALDCPKLKELYLSCNRIKSIPKTSYQLLDLENVSLSYNRLGTYPSFLDNSPNLKTLYLDHNALEELPNTAFQGMKELEVLDLSNNVLKELSDGIQDLEQLRSLDLRNNQLTELNTNLSKLKNLKYLYIEDNTQPKESSDTFYSFHYRELDFFNYHFHRDEKKTAALNRLPQCRCIIADEEEHEDIDYRTYWKRHYPQRSGNRLKNFPEAIRGLANLEYLAIANQDFKKLPKWIVELKHLKHLSIDYEVFQRSKKLLKQLPNLHTVHLFHNDLDQSKTENVKWKISPKMLKQLQEKWTIQRIMVTDHIEMYVPRLEDGKNTYKVLETLSLQK
ncbi:MAG: leucine-rich repeat domain-containing protein [Saprospiraceae bacterium]|nr:leucine-rich repeat domain-containing protein [Saprospiraceae bacterium]